MHGLVWDKRERRWRTFQQNEDMDYTRCKHDWLHLLYQKAGQCGGCSMPASPVKGWWHCDCQSHREAAGRTDFCKRKPITERQLTAALALAKLNGAIL